MLVERAPLPPHERSWRHPSEVGPTRGDIDGEPRGRTVMLAAGTLTVLLLVVVMVAALNPPSSDSPVAISATTSPGDVDRPPAPPPPDAPPDAAPPRLASFTAVPNAIAATPIVRPSSAEVASSMPKGDDLVLVHTPEVTYRMTWSDLEFLGIDETALVLDRDGRLVARIDGAEIVVLVED